MSLSFVPSQSAQLVFTSALSLHNPEDSNKKPSISAVFVSAGHIVAGLSSGGRGDLLTQLTLPSGALLGVYETR